MKKVVTCYLHHNSDTWSNGFEVWSTTMVNTSNLIFITALDVEFEIPDGFDPRPAQIAKLKEKQNKAAAAFHAMNNDLMRQINELQALEMV